jgi:hypothetical protein
MTWTIILTLAGADQTGLTRSFSGELQFITGTITLPGTILEEEVRRHNAAINAFAAHCRFQEGGAARGRVPNRVASPTLVTDVSPQLATEKQALSVTVLSVFKEKRPTSCFLCLGDESLLRYSLP